MCGIAGLNLSPDENVDARALASALLLGIEERGRHATGAAFFEDSELFIVKGPVAASRYVRDFDMAPGTTNAILHTRFATQGPVEQNENNHPIDCDGIVGVHNGVVWNDDAIFEMIGKQHRKAEVDSEAIFAALNYGGVKPVQALNWVEGSAAVAWLDTDGDRDLMHVARISSSPFIYAFTEAGSFLFASTAHAIERGARNVGLELSGPPRALAEGQYMKVRQGQIVSKASFSVDTGRVLTATERQALNLA